MNWVEAWEQHNPHNDSDFMGLEEIMKIYSLRCVGRRPNSQCWHHGNLIEENFIFYRSFCGFSSGNLVAQCQSATNFFFISKKCHYFINEVIVEWPKFSPSKNYAACLTLIETSVVLHLNIYLLIWSDIILVNLVTTPSYGWCHK